MLEKPIQTLQPSIDYQSNYNYKNHNCSS